MSVVILRRILTFSLAGAALVLLCASEAAGAATQLGQVSPVDHTGTCGASNTVQAEATEATTPPYTVPAAGGVITSWSHKGKLEGPGSGRLQIWRNAGGLNFTLVARSALRDFTAGAVNTFPTRIPVAGGELLGFRTATDTETGCSYVGAVGDRIASDAPTEAVPGETRAMMFGFGDLLLNVSARLELDSDRDGYGDETQDRCPTDASTHGPCPSSPVEPAAPPDLSFDAKRKQKAKKLKAEVGCGAVDCSVDLAGKAKVPRRSAKAVTAAKKKKFKLKPKSVDVAAGATETVRLKFRKNKKTVKKVKRLLRKGGRKARKRAKVVVEATATNAGGVDSAKERIRLKR